jgi:hypothetical protein
VQSRHRPACAQLRTSTGRSSIPETTTVESISRGVLDHPLSRVMTIGAGAMKPFAARNNGGIATITILRHREK